MALVKCFRTSQVKLVKLVFVVGFTYDGAVPIVEVFHPAPYILNRLVTL